MEVISATPTDMATGANFTGAAPAATTGDITGKLRTIIPGFDDLTRTGTDVIGDMLKGLPSPSATRTANAYFGVDSGMPGSEFVRNRGYDLYGQQAQQRKQQGLGDLLSFLGQYSKFVPSPGEELGAEQSRGQLGLGYAQLGEQSQQNAFDRWLQAQRLGLEGANVGANYLNAASRFY